MVIVYNNHMKNEKQNFNKINHFITDSYNTLPQKGVVIVKSVRNGFMVNDIAVKQVNNEWAVIRGETTLSTFRQRRIAILFAALIYKERYQDSNTMVSIDKQLDICLEDKNYYSVRLKRKDNLVLEDRLSRTENELNLIEQQLQLLEKSLSLQ